ncbi:MAG: DEAD/DEAH box helicase family protein [Chloroflexota bacterium]|nr:DEAD/DEAH box helicase family protein [Chloroflexota bacterium]
MKLRFKVQPYQTAAVQAVADCFEGQPMPEGAAIRYRIDPGRTSEGQTESLLEAAGFRNADLRLSDAQLLDNIQRVQRSQNLPVSSSLVDSPPCALNLDVEMETGTGKTYCYIKTMFELHQRYGWSKFIVVVPSIAIREGVAKTFAITADHFLEAYGRKARWFIYNSRSLHELESFSSDAGINVMIINVQAFNATGKDNRRIYEALDAFQSRKPIDVIAANRPILILDEPQKMEGKKTLESLKAFQALAMLRYSATHKTTHNKVHRLDALDAYNQKLVKRIAVRGITVKGQTGTNGYLYLQDIRVFANKAPEARVELEVKRKSEVKRELRTLQKGDNLFDLSQQLDQYRGHVVSEIDARDNTVHFTNGVVLNAGEAVGNVNESVLRRIQIREAIKAHFERERQLFGQGIKVLSLFFIDEVAKYRDYSREDEKGEYARILEEEYAQHLNEVLELELEPGSAAWHRYLKDIDPLRTHSGYFSIDRKSRHLVDPTVKKRGEDAGQSDDVDAYDLILKDKERLLSLSEPVRFIFSHSALREGWDNPNVFVICTLKHSDNTVSRRQEVGRGLRLAVDQHGERMDQPATVHAINVLTVVANESYKDFVSGLQRDISDTLADRPRIANAAYFTGKVMHSATGPVTVTQDQATDIEFYLIQNGYVDKKRQITDKYHDARKTDALAELPEELKPHAEQVIALIDSVFSDTQLPQPEDDRKGQINRLNANFHKREFQALWSRINRKAAYTVHFDSVELIRKCVATMDKELKVQPLQYTVVAGQQTEQIEVETLKKGEGFRVEESRMEKHRASVHSAVRYDLIGKLAEATVLTRATVAEILRGIAKPVFAQFATNPESFLTEAARLIREQKASAVVERLSYDLLEETWDTDIFTVAQSRTDFGQGVEPLKRHIYDYVATDSGIERKFVQELDTSAEVVVYAKLPRGFAIPTPVGDYNPDWAIAFEEGKVKHIYFVAETKGDMSSMQLREIEKSKIKCAQKLFDSINIKIAPESVKYDVVDSFEKLMTLVN